MKGHKPSDPGTTASQTLIHAAAGGTFMATGKPVFVHVSGNGWTSTAAVKFTVGVRYGTGAPPAAGAAVIGSQLGVDQTLLAAGVAAANGTGFCICDLINPAAAFYWLDIVYATATAADVANLSQISLLAFDVG